MSIAAQFFFMGLGCAALGALYFGLATRSLNRKYGKPDA